jgi:hypothetical protein
MKHHKTAEEYVAYHISYIKKALLKLYRGEEE